VLVIQHVTGEIQTEGPSEVSASLYLGQGTGFVTLPLDERRHFAGTNLDIFNFDTTFYVRPGDRAFLDVQHRWALVSGPFARASMTISGYLIPA
jgi:hypothetical protein